MNVAFHTFVKEVRFFDLGDDVLRDFLRHENMLFEPSIEPRRPIRRAIWQLFECPASSRAAQLLAGWNVVLVLAAVINFFIQTMPSFQAGSERDLSVIVGIGINHTAGAIGVLNGVLTPFFAVETICNSWFLFDLLVRFLVSPLKRKFFMNFMNIVDALSVFPYFIDLLSMANSSK